jgi:hypothetical protein
MADAQDADTRAERDTAGGGLDEIAREGLDHLQAAVKEMIGAARAVLDVAEELVDDPAAVQQVVGALGSLAAAAAARVRPHVERTSHHGDDEGAEGDEMDAGRVRRIRLS